MGFSWASLKAAVSWFCGGWFDTGKGNWGGGGTSGKIRKTEQGKMCDECRIGGQSKCVEAALQAPGGRERTVHLGPLTPESVGRRDVRRDGSKRLAVVERVVI